MVTIPAPTRASEEWPDADFDLPDGADITPPPSSDWDKDEDEDWDVEMDLGKTRGAKAVPLTQAHAASTRSSPLAKGAMVTIRPPLSAASETASSIDGDDDEGISTIKISALSATLTKGSESTTTVDDDVEADLDLPSDLTQLSLRPLSLHHRDSKASFEWGDRDYTTSSASSSDAYSSLGFHPSNNSTVISLPDTDFDCNDNEETDLEGLVIPTGLFESDKGRKHLSKILDQKKKITKIAERVNVTSPDPEDDFEIGLVINGDDDLSPSKFARTQETKRGAVATARRNSVPTRTTTAIRPPSRLKGDRPKTPAEQAGSMSRAPSRSSLLRPSLTRRTQTIQALPQQSMQAPSSFLAPKQGQSKIRSQKSHGVLKTPPSGTRKLSRKASLSSLLETSNTQGTSSTQESTAPPPPPPVPGYSATTAASRARVHTNSTSRMHVGGVHIPPTRPSTPSDNPSALRLTMPSLSRLKTRPSISGIFPPPTPPPPATPTSILPPQRPPSRASNLSVASSSVPFKPSRRLKRREFGDGTELDAIEDLPTDRDKEAKFRVQPKVTQNRIPSSGSSKTEKECTKGTIRRKKETENVVQPATSTISLNRKKSRMEGLSRNENPQKKKPSSSAQTRRKPTLIRNLGGVGAPKVVGEMRWNPQTLRWEGNDQALRDFDSASARPALITHLTGSAIIGSPGGAPAARVVGNMVFDPAKMCWISTLPPEEDEPDVFANLADDEEDSWEKKGGTIRASIVRPSTSTDPGSHSDSSRKTSSPAPSIRSRTQSICHSDSDRASRASLVFDLDDNFVELCRAAEARHRAEMKGWTLGHNESAPSFTAPDRSCLYEIRALATRQY